jgi:hypothetical protein
VWCFIFREAVIARDAGLAERLIEWLLPFSERAPLEGVEAAVEQVRLYLSLRAGYQSRFLSRERLQDILVLCGALPLGLLLPFMQTTTDADEFDRTVRQIWGVTSTPLCAPPGAASDADEKEDWGDSEDEDSDGAGAKASAGPSTASAPPEERRSSKDSRGTKGSRLTAGSKGGSKAELSVSSSEGDGSYDDEQSDADDDVFDDDSEQSASDESDPEDHFAWPSRARPIQAAASTAAASAVESRTGPSAAQS